MSDKSAPQRPTVIQYLRYCYGRPLPPELREWVRNDLAGPRATVRMMMRAVVPTALILAPFWLLPTTFDVRLTMTLPIFLMLIFFAHALNKVWRRHMLRMHRLDPNLVDEISRHRDAHIHQSYIERFGPRPESADQRTDDI